MNRKGQSVIAVTALSLALLAAVPIARADEASNNSAASAASADADNDSPGQVLEIPQSFAPTPTAPSTSGTWSDGTNTYTWQNESTDSDQQTGDSQTPAPPYAGVQEYMSQGEQNEAMGPAVSPMFGIPMFLVDPFLFSGGYPLQAPPPPSTPHWSPPPHHFHFHGFHGRR